MDALRSKLARWVDEWKLALVGVGLAARFWQFWVTAVIVFLFFGTLLNMLAFPSSFQYLWDLPDFGRKLNYLGEMFLGVFGYRKDGLADFAPMLTIAILQAVIIALIVIVWQKRKAAREAEAMQRSRVAPGKTDTKKAEAATKNRTVAAAGADSGAHLSKAGIVTGLAVLAGGCPTCGTSLLAPVLGAIFSGGSAVIGDTISWVLTLLAIIIALFSLKKVGLDAYVIIVSERRRNREK